MGSRMSRTRFLRAARTAVKCLTGAQQAQQHSVRTVCTIKNRQCPRANDVS